ncbi:MAG: DoxX-like family protein, partial [Planctomycetota bacterium]|nr:DoxX-like family protein [Planctomycetota bacterium]
RLLRIVRWTLGAVWLYHGLVPKIILRHPDEQQLIRDAGLGEEWVIPMVLLGGAIELGLALIVLVVHKKSWPLYMTIVFMIAALLGAIVNSPQYLGAAFNPVTLNLCVIALSIVGIELSRSESKDPSPAA